MIQLQIDSKSVLVVSKEFNGIAPIHESVCFSYVEFASSC